MPLPHAILDRPTQGTAVRRARLRGAARELAASFRAEFLKSSRYAATSLTAFRPAGVHHLAAFLEGEAAQHLGAQHRLELEDALYLLLVASPRRGRLARRRKSAA